MSVDDKKLREVLSQNIKSARLSSNLTQDNLAELSDISLDFLKSVEAARSGISVSTLINICCALNITPNELLKEFFRDSCNKNENIITKLKFLNQYQLDVIETLVQHFTNNEMN